MVETQCNRRPAKTGRPNRPKPTHHPKTDYGGVIAWPVLYNYILSLEVNHKEVL
jgi:hypothetical protein